MSEGQIETPGSNADNSVGVAKLTATKDKFCPFCTQLFTSSSLGRHLDLYIKEKNPKAADGIHDVEKIRKIRGGVTRRTPRNSSAKRESMTPAAMPNDAERKSPQNEHSLLGNGSPRAQQDKGSTHPDAATGSKPIYYIASHPWEATGVINNIPASTKHASHVTEKSERERTQRSDGRERSLSRQMAKSTLDQKQKMTDALDSARAAELALREIVGSIRAAKQRLAGSIIFDYDPLSFDFPTLVLHCLAPSPTLMQSSPIATASSWSTSPPSEQQFEALQAHFDSEFHRWKVSCKIATMAPRDDLSYPPPQQEFPEPADIAEDAESQATELQGKVRAHLQSTFAHWSAMSTTKRTEIWILELARSIGRKSREVQNLRSERDKAIQELEHLKLQHDELSRLKYPREFRISPPATLSMKPEDMYEMGLRSLGYKATPGSFVGWNVADRNMHIDAVVQRTIERWKSVVKQARNTGGMAAQLPLEESDSHVPTDDTAQPQLMDEDEDADADADADMEIDDIYMGVPEASHRGGSKATMPSGRNSFKSSNNNNTQQNASSANRDKLPVQTMSNGYVRISAT